MQRILVYSEDRELQERLASSLPASRYLCEEIREEHVLLHRLDDRSPDVLVLDARHVGGNLAMISMLRARGGFKLLWLAPEGQIGSAVEAVRRGADFYLPLPLQTEVFQQVLAEWSREDESALVRWLPEGPPPSVAEEVVGRSEAIRRVFQLAVRVAPTDSTVLITGETGVGKEMVARAIHQASRRSHRTFVAINCGAIPDTLLDSELFGYRKGAFTGAVADRAGLFEQANGGTFFLDEIAELSPAMQVKLLRVLEEGDVRRLGDVETRRVDVRVLAATNRDLGEAMQAGRFRADLFYRLNVIRIHIPPLRERREDIPPLIKHFLEKYNARFDRNVITITRDALFALMQYEYPGNVRELENVIQHAVILSDDNVVGKTALPPQLFQRLQLALEGPRGDDVVSLNRAEEDLIKHALLKYQGNQTEAAKSLGISRSTLWRKIKTYKLENFK